jgi:hypothetical protein
LNRFDQEELVVELRNQGKTYREIAKLAQISPRDIKPILDKYGTDKNRLNTDHTNYRHDGDDDESRIVAISSKAYKLFSQGQSPIKVSIALNIEGPRVLELYKQYLDMKHMGSFSIMYKEVGNELPELIKFYDKTKRNRIDITLIKNYLTTITDDLPAVQKQSELLKRKTHALRFEKNEVETQLRDVKNQVDISREHLRTIVVEIQEAQNEMRELDRQKTEFKRFVAHFRDNDQGYKEIKEFVETRVKMILRDNNRLLDLAVISVLTSLSNDTDKCKYLFEMLDLENQSRQKRKINDWNDPHIKNTPLTLYRNNPFFNPKGLLGAQIIGNGDDLQAQRYKDDIVEMSKLFYERLRQELTVDIMKNLENRNSQYITWVNDSRRT